MFPSVLKYCPPFAELKCLQVILYDGSNKLEDDCKTMLRQRMEMFRNAAALAPENLSELYTQVLMSPAKRYFMVLMLSCVGLIFVFGIVCGRVGRRSAAMKNK